MYCSTSRALATRNPTPRTSRTPGTAACSPTPRSYIGDLGSRLVFAGFGAHPHFVALVDKRRHLNDEARLERGRFHLRTGRRAFDPRHRLLDDEIHCGRELNANRFALVELDADDRVGDQVVHRIAESFGGNMDLIVVRGVHEVVMVAVAV